MWFCRYSSVHLSYETFISDNKGKIKIKRPAYLLSSSTFIEHGDSTPIGEVHMRWHLWRRKYDLYKGYAKKKPKSFVFPFFLLTHPFVQEGAICRNQWKISR
jgi:hypothetical protein